MTLAPAAAPHWVYRLFDQDGAPLYIGCTANISQRLAQHSAKDWWGNVRGIEVEHYALRVDALEAERAAIEAGQPKHNVVYTDKAPSENGWQRRRARMALCHKGALPCRDAACKEDCASEWHRRGLPCNHWPNCHRCDNATDDDHNDPLIKAWDESHWRRTLAPLEAWIASQEHARSA